MSDFGDDIFVREPHIDLYALRAFTITSGQVGSVIHNKGDVSHWSEGVCRAVCLRDPEHHAPEKDCRCGVYGAFTLEHIRTQYPQETNRICAVILTEGKTTKGRLGLRCAVAQVVAYWCAHNDDDDTDAQLCAEQFPGARRYRNIDLMIKRYGLR